MCQNANYYQIISYLCTAIGERPGAWLISLCHKMFFHPPYPQIEGESRHQIAEALIVQRIERGFPKPKIWVRFPVGVQQEFANHLHFRRLAFLFCINYIKKFLARGRS